MHPPPRLHPTGRVGSKGWFEDPITHGRTICDRSSVEAAGADATGVKRLLESFFST